MSDSDAGDVNKPVDRRKKLTKNQRNQKKKRKERLEAQEDRAKERRQQRQYEKIGVFINEDIRENKESRARIDKKVKETALEKEKQEKKGIVTKAAKIGRKAYRMRKTDFQLEEELAGSLREARTIGKDDFLRDRFDSVYRQNMLDVVDVVHESEKKRKIKAAYKFKQRSGGIYGTVSEKLKRKNDKKQAELDARSKKGFLKDDLIML